MAKPTSMSYQPPTAASSHAGLPTTCPHVSELCWVSSHHLASPSAYQDREQNQAGRSSLQVGDAVGVTGAGWCRERALSRQGHLPSPKPAS